MKRTLILAVPVALAAISCGAPASANGYYATYTEDAVNGAFIDLGYDALAHVNLQGYSDGEVQIDPYHYGADTSDGVQLSSNWALYSGGAGVGAWVPLADGKSWVLPACNASGCENNDIVEQIGKWVEAGATWNFDGVHTIAVFEAGGAKLSDLIQIGNFGPGGNAAISFNSVPGPIAGAGVPALLALFGYGFFRRRSSAKRA